MRYKKCDSLSEVFDSLRSCKYGELYIYRTDPIQGGFKLYIPHELEYRQLIKKWEKTKKKNRSYKETVKAFKTTVRGYDAKDNIFIEKKFL